MPTNPLKLAKIFAIVGIVLCFPSTDPLNGCIFCLVLFAQYKRHTGIYMAAIVYLVIAIVFPVAFVVALSPLKFKQYPRCFAIRGSLGELLKSFVQVFVLAFAERYWFTAVAQLIVLIFKIVSVFIFCRGRTYLVNEQKEIGLGASKKVKPQQQMRMVAPAAGTTVTAMQQQPSIRPTLKHPYDNPLNPTTSSPATSNVNVRQ